jgi:hypothetical protein
LNSIIELIVLLVLLIHRQKHFPPLAHPPRSYTLYEKRPKFHTLREPDRRIEFITQNLPASDQLDLERSVVILIIENYGGGDGHATIVPHVTTSWTRSNPQTHLLMFLCIFPSFSHYYTLTYLCVILELWLA